MNPQQAENLRILIRHMESKVTRTLDMSFVFNKECGTPACALGEAATLPHFNMCAPPTPAYRGRYVIVDGEERSFTEVVERLFADRGRLFGGSDLNKWHRREVTPQEWALEARKVLAENGYSMDDGKADAFVESIKRMDNEARTGAVCWPV